jgi:hypothetical protein
MLQVAMDLETELYQLEQRRMELIKRRDDIIAQAELMIDIANEQFDYAAVPLGRAINELRERLKKEDEPADKKERTRRTIPLEGLDDDEQAHYKELLARKKKR